VIFREHIILLKQRGLKFLSYDNIDWIIALRMLKPIYKCISLNLHVFTLLSTTSNLM